MPGRMPHRRSFVGNTATIAAPTNRASKAMGRLAIATLLSTLVASPAFADCKEEILTIMDRSTLAGPFHTETAFLAGDRQAVMTSDVVPPSDLHTKTTADGKTREVVKIGDRAWVNDGGGGGWKEAPPQIAARLNQMASTMRSIQPSLVNDVDCQGVKTVEGRDLLVFAYKIDLPGGKGSSSNTLYADPQSRLPTRVVVEGRMGSIKSRTDMKYTFDSSIKITPPETPDQ
jgi:hypothetical protein